MKTRPTRLLVYVAVSYVCILHLTWAALILWDSSAANSTAVHAVFALMGSPRMAAYSLILVAACSLAGMFGRLPWAAVLMVPQQAFLLVAASGAISAMVVGHFADGVERSTAFIVGDQIHVVLTAIFHGMAIVSTGIESQQ